MTSDFLDAKFLNPFIRDGTEWALATLKYLKDAIGAAGYKPGTEPPAPDMREIIYAMRPLEEWHLLARTDPNEALDQMRDWANIARRNNRPETVVAAARAVMAEAAAQGITGE
jgi:hypothetical protein